MNENDRKFRDGEIIFREGDASQSAFVLLSGEVVLTKKGARGDIQLATLGAGEMFGEMGVLDGSIRSATARAKGSVSVRVIPRDDFIDSVKTRPEAALTVMGKLVERLRAADEMLARGAKSDDDLTATPVQSPAPVSARRGLFDRLWAMTKRERPPRLEVRIARLTGDADRHHTRYLVRALSRRPAIHVRMLDESLTPPASSEAVPAHLAEIAGGARAWLRKANADLLVWGKAPTSGTTLELRFIPAEPEDETLPGAFGLGTRLNLPADFPAALGDVLAAVVLAAGSKRERSDPVLVKALTEAVKANLPMIQEMPADLSRGERAAVTLCLANAAAIVAVAGTADMHYVAVHGYRKSLHLAKRDDGPLDWAMIQRNLGVMLQLLADRQEDPKLLTEAADCFRAAMEVLTRAAYPLPWATSQHRLGKVYYRQDLLAGDTELIKRALACFQAALQVINRAERPLLWAEVMNDFAQAALLLGELLPSREALERAVAAARAALEVRVGDASLLPWAASQNTLGSALFLLGKQTRDKAMLMGAVDAFRQAEEVYRRQNVARMVTVTEKNLSRAAEVLEAVAPSRLPRMRWEPDDA